MATTIILKKSTLAGAVPLSGDLDVGEIAINIADRKIYTIDGSSTIRRLDGAYVSATAPSNPVAGDLWYDTANDLLKTYNGSSFASAGYTTISDLEDVTLSAVANDEFLVYSGGSWINKTWAEADIQQASATTADARSAISVTDAGGDGSLTYSSATGIITYTGPSASEVQAHFSGGTGISLTSGTIAIDFSEFTSDSIVEGTTNLFFADSLARNAISVTDAGGDGSLSYSSATGIITYTGPSASEVRAHFSGGTGVTITDGTISIGQDIATTANVTFNDVTLTGTIYGPAAMVIDPAVHGDNSGSVTIKGDLIVDGTTTSVNSNEVNIGDSIIVLNADEAGTPSQNAGFTVERGTAANVSWLWNETLDAWDADGYELQNVIIDGGSY